MVFPEGRTFPVSLNADVSVYSVTSGRAAAFSEFFTYSETAERTFSVSSFFRAGERPEVLPVYDLQSLSER